MRTMMKFLWADYSRVNGKTSYLFVYSSLDQLSSNHIRAKRVDRTTYHELCASCDARIGKDGRAEIIDALSCDASAT